MVLTCTYDCSSASMPVSFERAGEAGELAERRIVAGRPRNGEARHERWSRRES